MTDLPAPTAAPRVALVVDDEPKVREVVCVFLRMGGVTALSAGTAEEALNVSATHQGGIHLLLADVGLPEMTAVELAGKLTEARPGLRVLLCSGEAQGELVEADTPSPNTPARNKLFRLNDLLGKVREVLGGNQNEPSS